MEETHHVSEFVLRDRAYIASRTNGYPHVSLPNADTWRIANGVTLAVSTGERNDVDYLSPFPIRAGSGDGWGFTQECTDAAADGILDFIHISQTEGGIIHMLNDVETRDPVVCAHFAPINTSSLTGELAIRIGSSRTVGCVEYKFPPQ